MAKLYYKPSLASLPPHPLATASNCLSPSPAAPSAAMATGDDFPKFGPFSRAARACRCTARGRLQNSACRGGRTRIPLLASSQPLSSRLLAGDLPGHTASPGTWQLPRLALSPHSSPHRAQPSHTQHSTSPGTLLGGITASPFQVCLSCVWGKLHVTDKLAQHLAGARRHGPTTFPKQTAGS